MQRNLIGVTLLACLVLAGAAAHADRPQCSEPHSGACFLDDPPLTGIVVFVWEDDLPPADDGTEFAAMLLDGINDSARFNPDGSFFIHTIEQDSPLLYCPDDPGFLEAEDFVEPPPGCALGSGRANGNGYIDPFTGAGLCPISAQLYGTVTLDETTYRLRARFQRIPNGDEPDGCRTRKNSVTVTMVP